MIDMLKTATGKLYTLLTACKPDDAKIKKRLLITEILEMSGFCHEGVLFSGQIEGSNL